MTRASSLVAGSLLAALAVACGSDARPPTAPASATRPPTIEAQPRDAGDLVVATVAGHPVYASCVAAQARHLGLTVDAALATCVDFELLAQAADARGLRADPDVIDAWRREMVRAVIAAELSPLTRLDDLPAAFVAPLLARRGRFLRRPEIRLSHYARIEVAKTAEVDGAEDRAARAVAEAIHAELGGQEGLLFDELFAAADRLAGGLPVARSDAPYATPEHSDVPVRVAVAPYREALYAIPEIGRISPPVRTPWGWDLILWWDTWPETDFGESFFQNARQTYFGQWADQLGAGLGLRPWRDEARLAALAEDVPAEPAPEAPAP